MLYTWEEQLELNKRALDTIDIKPYLQKHKGDDLRDVMANLEEDFEDVASDPALDGDLFNFMDAYDFMLYLKDRYEDIRINYWEETHYKIM